MHVLFDKPTVPTTDTVVLMLSEELTLGGKTADFDKKTGGTIARVIASGKFKGKKAECYVIPAPHGVECEAVILAGLGKAKDITSKTLLNLGGKIYAQLTSIKAKDAFILVEDNDKTKIDPQDRTPLLAYGAKLRSYYFDKYKTKEKLEDKPSVRNITFLTDGTKDAQEEYEKLKKIANGVFLARDVITEPPNVLHPESYAEICEERLPELGIEVRVLGVKEMKQLGMGALLGVGQGSVRESKMVIMRWYGDPKGKEEPPVAFVGKGVTFDTGGISLKPANGMEDMKYDMAGSAAVVGVMKALAGREAKVNAVGVIGLVENMPGHNAQRPSDVVHTMSGQTVEVLNTDAEGRLVLADALWYTQDLFKPKAMVNLATLTGAITIALGDKFAGIFSNNDVLSEKLIKAGADVGEELWRLPISPVGEGYDKFIDSQIADIQNISSEKGAGSITAAQFLQRFVGDTPWAHLDIAGVAWTKKDRDICPKGAVGFGVRLLDQFVAENYEG